MSIKNREVTHICQVVLLAGCTLAVLFDLGPAPVIQDAQQAGGWGAAACLGYGLASLSFTAFPSRRRSDLAGACALLLLVSGLLGLAAGRGLRPDLLACDLAGAAVAYGASFLEAFRSAARSSPQAAFTLKRRVERRRSRLRPIPHGSREVLDIVSA